MDDGELDDRLLCSLAELKVGPPEGRGEGMVFMDLLKSDGEMLRVAVTGLTTGKILDAALAAGSARLTL